MVTSGDKRSYPQAPAHHTGFLLVARCIAGLVLLVSFIVMYGWASGQLILARFHPEWPPMVPNTALCFALASLAVLLYTGNAGMRRAAQVLAALLFAAGAVFSAEWVLGADWGIRYWLFGSALRTVEVYRVAPGTAVCFMLLAAAMLFNGLRRWPMLTETLLHILGMLVAVRFAAFPFDVVEFTALKGFRTMAVLTSTCFILMWLAMIMLRGRQGVLGLLLSKTAGGRMARRLLLASLLIPFLNGWLRLRLQEVGRITDAEGAVLSAMLNAAVFSAVVLWAAWQLDANDRLRRQHEAALARSETRLRRIFESPMLGVFYWTVQGGIVDANEHFLQLIGYTRADMQAGRISWTERTPAKYAQLEAAKLREVMKAGAIKPYEKEFIHADGHAIPVLIGAILHAGSQEGVAFVLDDTDRQQGRRMLEQRSAELAAANAEISQSAQRLRAVLDAAQDAVISIDRESRIIEWNRGSETLFGWSAAEALGEHVSLIIPARYRKEHVAGMAHFLETGAGPVIGHVIEIEAQDRSGRVFPVELSVGQPVGEGEHLLFTAFLADITERRAAQELINQRNLELELLNAELQRSEKRMRAMFDSPLVGAYLWRIDGSISAANEHMRTITGYSAEDVAAGKLSWQSLSGPENPDYPERAAQVVRSRGGFGPAETVVSRADGTRMPVLTGAYMVEGPEEEGVAFMLDMSAQHAARQQIEERNAALQRSEERIRAIFESPLTPMAFWRIDGTIIEANQSFLDLTGYTAEEVAAGEVTWTRLTPPELHAQMQPRSRRLAAERVIQPEEDILLRADGTRLHVLAGGALLPASDGDCVAFLLDVTEQHAARETIRQRNAELEELAGELARSQEHLQRLFDSPMLGIFYWNLEGRILDANDRFLQMLGFERADLQSGRLGWFNVAPPEFEDIDRERSTDLARTGAMEPYEKEFIRADGTRLPVLVGAATLDMNKLEGVAYATDISEMRRQRQEIVQRNAELTALTDELARNEARLRAVFDTSLVGMFFWKLGGRVLSANPRFFEITGLSPQAVAEGVSFSTLVSAGSEEAMLARRQELAEQGFLRSAELLIVRPDGREVPIVITSVLLDREAQEGVSLFLDISEQHAARIEIEARNAELQRINAELDSFSYSVSHDLRAPLRAVEGFSKALEEDYSDVLDADAKRYLMRIRSGTVRMAQLIDDLLQLSRVGRAEMAPQLVDLSELGQAVRQALGEAAPDRQVEWAIQPGLIAQGDPRLLRIVLDNLLGNAFKFSGKREQARVELGQMITAQGMAYYVRDNGDGFDMAYAGKLFTAFQRLHQQEQFPGTGIGLSIVRRIVNRHGGEVWAESSPGNGATFYFTLRFGENNG